MLILGRRHDEKVIVQVGDVTFSIQVCQIRPGSVRLGFDIPDEVTCDREEVYLSKQNEKELERQRKGGGR